MRRGTCLVLTLQGDSLGEPVCCHSNSSRQYLVTTILTKVCMRRGTCLALTLQGDSLGEPACCHSYSSRQHLVITVLSKVCMRPGTCLVLSSHGNSLGEPVCCHSNSSSQCLMNSPNQGMYETRNQPSSDLTVRQPGGTSILSHQLFKAAFGDNSPKQGMYETRNLSSTDLTGRQPGGTSMLSQQFFKPMLVATVLTKVFYDFVTSKRTLALCGANRKDWPAWTYSDLPEFSLPMWYGLFFDISFVLWFVMPDDAVSVINLHYIHLDSIVSLFRKRLTTALV